MGMSRLWGRKVNSSLLAVAAAAGDQAARPSYARPTTSDSHEEE